MVWDLPEEYLQGEKPRLLDVIFCCTKREANKTKKEILADKQRIAHYEQQGEAWHPTHTILVQVLEERDGKVLVRLPNGSKTSIAPHDLGRQVS